ncbi:hypothetical protein L3X38_023163 [Prunus dulcis]|uniref:Uncharacterized protein n=1 Tax=Prunus dulcis TaxID=3755 RepID=A0AAD4VXG9_PRUDU|nr:hypothetical protein L3X38_023163 [Prunus dulcis]
MAAAYLINHTPSRVLDFNSDHVSPISVSKKEMTSRTGQSYWSPQPGAEDGALYEETTGRTGECTGRHSLAMMKSLSVKKRPVATT